MSKTARSSAGAGTDTPAPQPSDPPADKPNLAPTPLPERDEFTGMGGDYEIDLATGKRIRVQAAPNPPTPDA